MEKMFKNQIVNLVDQYFTAAKNKGISLNYLDEEQILNGRTFKMKGKDFINFGSCSYLGLETDNRVKEGIIDAVNKYGASFIMSRSYASSPLFKNFESLLTQIFEAYPVVTPSTTLGSFSFMSVFINKGDLVLLDQSVHHSVQLAASTISDRDAKLQIVNHNDIEELAKILEGHKNFSGKIWYCADGIYSMFGDLINLDEILKLLNKYENFYCYVDDAHGMSIHGKNGKGFVLGEQNKLHEKMVVAVSLSKSFGMGCGGALIFPNEEWQRKCQICGPTMIFSSPIPPPMLGAGVALAKIHLTNEIASLQKSVFDKIQYFRTCIESIGLTSMSDEKSPVQYIKIGNFDKASDVVGDIIKAGYFVNLGAFPAVSRFSNGIRVTFTNHLEKDDITNLVEQIEKSVALVLPKKVSNF